jgi:hypothetical protein
LVGALQLRATALPAQRLFTRTGPAWLETAWARLTASRARGVLLVFLLGLAASAAPSWQGSLPEPGVHDEFGYLLEADTFAHGRLTNPPHPFWPHFESMHLLQQPTYTAKYPPAQGLILALGRVVGGHPIVGVWLSVALASAGLCWMLRAWVPPRWAVLGGMLAAVSLATSAWAQSYWGGAVAAFGGALMFGSVRRLVRRGRWRDGLVLGVGLAVLANSRPYEGLVASLPVAAVLARWAWRQQPAWRKPAVALLPCVAVLAVTGAWMAWYNYRVTGDPLRTPYQAHYATYAAAPLFLWHPPLAEMPAYRHQSMYDYYVGCELPHYLRKRVALGLNGSALTRLWIFARFFIGPQFVLPLLLVCKHGRDRWTAFAALTVGLVLLALTQTLYLLPHYTAPVTALVFFLIVQGLRHLWRLQWRGQPVGRVLVRGTVALPVLFLALAIAFRPVSTAWPAPRVRVAARLEALAGRHLVVVRYGPRHCCHDEWVYNAADIDGSRIVWARDMGSAENRRLLRYFNDRRAWLLEVDQEPAPLRPYPPPEDGPPPAAE